MKTATPLWAVALILWLAISFGTAHSRVEASSNDGARIASELAGIRQELGRIRATLEKGGR